MDRKNGDVSTPYPDSWEADVVMSDGRTLHVRPIAASDAKELRRFHARLSEHSIYLRYFGAKPELSDAELRHLTVVDHDERVAFIGLLDDEIVGVARYERISVKVAEVAFLVRDDVQGRGVGSILLEHLAGAARDRGLSTFLAEVLPVNQRMLDTFHASGFQIRTHRADEVIEVAIDIDPAPHAAE